MTTDQLVSRHEDLHNNRKVSGGDNILLSVGVGTGVLFWTRKCDPIKRERESGDEKECKLKGSTAIFSFPLVWGNERYNLRAK